MTREATAPPRGTPRRSLLAAIAGLLALAGAAHSATWWVVTKRIEDGLPGFVAVAAQQGWRVEAGPVRRAGWPWRATVRAPGLVAARQLGGSELRVTAEWLDVSIAPAEPHTLRIEPGGTQTLSWRDVTAAVATREAALRTPLDGDAPLTLRARDLQALTPAGEGVRIGTLDARFDAVALVGSASAVRPSPAWPAPFDGGADVSLRALATRPGALEVPDAALAWGPLRATGSGAGELDQDRQPAFRAALRVQGAAETLDAASRSGLLQPGPAAAAKAVLGLLSLAAKGGPIALPVVLQGSTLTVAQFPLLRLPPLGAAPP